MSKPTEAENTLDAYGRNRYRLPLTGEDAGGSWTVVPVDNNGRIMVTELTDREIAEELLATLRQIADVISQIGQNPASMMARFMPGMGSVMAAVNQGK